LLLTIILYLLAREASFSYFIDLKNEEELLFPGSTYFIYDFFKVLFLLFLEPSIFFYAEKLFYFLSFNKSSTLSMVLTCLFYWDLNLINYHTCYDILIFLSKLSYLWKFSHKIGNLVSEFLMKKSPTEVEETRFVSSFLVDEA